MNKRSLGVIGIISVIGTTCMVVTEPLEQPEEAVDTSYERCMETHKDKTSEDSTLHAFCKGELR